MGIGKIGPVFSSTDTRHSDNQAPGGASSPSSGEKSRVIEFELAFPSRSSTSHTRHSLIARASPFRWLPKSGRLQTKTNIKLWTQKKPAPLRGTSFLCVEHETRFELATLTLARRTRNLLKARNRMGFQESWSGRFRQGCALRGTGVHVVRTKNSVIALNLGGSPYYEITGEGLLN